MNSDYQRIEKAIHFLHQNYTEQPSLDQLSQAIHLSPYHLQRLFKRWAGVTPKQFLQCVTLKYANKALQNGACLLDASESVGFSSSSRLHDLYVNFNAMTPAQYRSKGQGLLIEFGKHESPFGSMVIAQTDKGICSLYFTENDSQAELTNELAQHWPNAQIVYRPQVTEKHYQQIFQSTPAQPVNICVSGTQFQLKVWQALLKIPFGQVRNYGQIAQLINASKASRAVGTAIGKNPIALLIPCHRVIKSTGVIGNYHWGETRKKSILTWEACKSSA